MLHPLLPLTALFLLMAAAPDSAQNPKQCLHDQLETRSERTRREKAVELASEINRAQGIARRFGARPGQGPYLPFDQLFNVPAPPDGFRVQHLTDGETYSFSVKDTRDPCLYAVFSDQSGDVYEAVPTSSRGSIKLLTQKEE
jgi:hypothetical protein